MITFNKTKIFLGLCPLIYSPIAYAACPMEEHARLDRGYIAYRQTYVVSSSSLTDLPSRISSTSGCGEPYGMSTPAQEYLVRNYPLLQEDVAKGNGSSIAALEVLEGCQPDILGKIMQNNYGRLFEKDHPKTTYHEFQRLLHEETTLKTQCHH